MIQRHAFNSRWWGGEVGVVEDAAFFGLDAAARARELSRFEWVERREPLSPEAVRRLAASGFVQADAQVRFRIGLGGLAPTPSIEHLGVHFADDDRFEIEPESLADFRHERFLALPDVDAERVNRRYVLWSSELIAEHPATCLRVALDDETQGWFLSRYTERGLELTLASLARDARLTGHGLYLRALLAYRERGHRMGHASFSVCNSPVLGIYSSLGARFLPAAGCWLWHPELGPTHA